MGRDLKIAFFWTGISGYMAGCWRALAVMEGVTLHVFSKASKAVYSFDKGVMDGVNWTELTDGEYRNPTLIRNFLLQFGADVVVIAGWTNHAYRLLATHSDCERPIFILAMDTPFRGDYRQRLAPIILRRF